MELVCNFMEKANSLLPSTMANSRIIKNKVTGYSKNKTIRSMWGVGRIIKDRDGEEFMMLMVN